MKPLLSVVIANYNYGRFLSTAIESVLNQADDRVELIVVDGGSTDNSIDVIKRYCGKIAWWVSEPDEGQSDAFNKGFAHAHGKYLTWLNADDVFLPGAIERVLQAMESRPEVEWFAGATVYFASEGRTKTATVPLGNFLPRLLGIPAWMRVSGPSSFFSKELLSRAGEIQRNLHYVMDIDLWMRFTGLGTSLWVIDDYLWGFRLHEESKTSSSLARGIISDRFAAERMAIRVNNRIGRNVEKIHLCMKRLCALLSFGYLRRFVYLNRHQKVIV